MNDQIKNLSNIGETLKRNNIKIYKSLGQNFLFDLNLTDKIVRNSESNASYSNKPSGAEGWEDRSYGNSSENSEFESGRSRRKRGVSSDGNSLNNEN